MAEKDKLDLRRVHEELSKSCFNSAWDLIEKNDRSAQEEDMMIHMAHASVFHWLKRVDCTDQNLSVGYWQLSRVHALAGMGESALRYAKTCLEYSEQHGVAAVFLGYAWEAIARASGVLGDVEYMQSSLSKAEEIAMTLADDDREQLLADLKNIS